MALEKVEENPDLLRVLRDAVNFYLRHVGNQRDAEAVAVAQLSKEAGQVLQMTEKKEQLQTEIEALSREKRIVEKEHDTVPFLALIQQIDRVEQDILKRQEDLRLMKDRVNSKEKLSNTQPGNALLIDEVRRLKAVFDEEQVNVDFIVRQLEAELARYKKSFTDSNVDPEDIRKRKEEADAKMNQLIEVIVQKQKLLKGISPYIEAYGSRITQLKALQEDLTRYCSDYDLLVTLAEILLKTPSSS